MKIYVGHYKKYDYMNELYLPIINSELGKREEFIFPHLTDETFNSQEVIAKSDLFIAEISVHSTGLGIEIGRTEVKGKKILCICNEKVKMPSCLKYVNVDKLYYKDSADMVKKLDNYIKSLKENNKNM